MLIVYSGGLDSTVLLNEYKNNIEMAISFNYGSKHNNRELYYAKHNCNLLNIKHLIIDLPFIDKYFNSSLLRSGGDIPLVDYNQESISKTVVPFRNGIMLSIAAGIAESNKIDKILIANHAGDHVIYPDCRPAFINEMNSAVAYGTNNRVNIVAPYTYKSKMDIALIGNKLNIDFSNTWSCYVGGDTHCGQCSTCLERKIALKGFDNTLYEV